MLRAVRVAARFDFAIDPATAEAIRVMAGAIRVVSAERIADELRKLLVDRHRARGLRLFLDLGLAEPLLPELLPMVGLPQGPPAAPTGDLWEHVLGVLDRLGPAPSFPLAFAALLHDVGKPRSVGRTPDRYTFYNHEHVGRRMAAEIGLRLRLSNDERERIEWLVEHHMYLSGAKQMRLAKLKRILVHPGTEELLALHRADALASTGSTEAVDYCEQLLRDLPDTELNPPPLITGHDLVRLGLEPGPQFKQILDSVREAQLDGTIRSKKDALALVRRLLEGPGEP
jgi:poly(A) polymerase